MKRTNLTLGLFGFGCVGQGLYDILNQTKGIKAEVKKICVKDRSKKRPIPLKYFTFDKDVILNDPAIDVIVELIDDASEAFNIVSAAMKNGKKVVTANKKMVAEHFDELLKLKEENQVSILYEASTCASIPIIRNLEEYYDNDLVKSIAGIFNGSSNYILTNVFENNLSFDLALKKAQELGFAETDPTLDISGLDSKYKLSIINAHAFGKNVPEENIFHLGIQSLSPADINYAKEKRYKIKLVAKSIKIDGELYSWVIPQFIDMNDFLYSIENEFNGVIIEGAFSEKQCFVGKGAGGHPTGSAVLSDISALTYDYKYEYKKYSQNNVPTSADNFLIEVYIRYKNENDINQLSFLSIHEQYQSDDFNYIIGNIDIKSLSIKEIKENKNIFIAQTTNQAVHSINVSKNISGVHKFKEAV
jgi:homoserine dehydrogenase